MEKVKIVVVDDSAFSVTILSEMLIERGFDVVGSASSLEEVKEVVEQKKPDLVTMDMTMPGTDGLECTRAVHKIDENIKVIMVSSMMDEEIIKKAKENKISMYIQKPVDPDEITTAINRIMAGEELFDELNKEYFKVFKESTSDILNRLTKTIPEYAEEVAGIESFSSRGISVVIGIIGKYSGRMIIDLAPETATEIAKVVLKREPKSNEEVLAMIGEFANIIAGNASSILNRMNKLFGFRVAPPSTFYGKSLGISTSKLEVTSVLAKTQFGEIFLNVGFKRGDGEWM